MVASSKQVVFSFGIKNVSRKANTAAMTDTEKGTGGKTKVQYDVTSILKSYKLKDPTQQ